MDPAAKDVEHKRRSAASECMNMPRTIRVEHRTSPRHKGAAVARPPRPRLRRRGGQTPRTKGTPVGVPYHGRLPTALTGNDLDKPKQEFHSATPFLMGDWHRDGVRAQLLPEIICFDN